MTTPHSARRFRRGSAVALLVIAAGACGLEEQPIPNGPTGPSGLANAFALTASPNVLPRDGQSLSTVTLRATDVTGGPLAGQRFRVRVTPNDAASTTEVTTDAAGRATFSVTAPPITSPATDISITATAEGGFSDASSRVLSITLSGNPNTGPPVPSFTVSPATPEIDQLVTFNASATTDEGAACTNTCAFQWDFGDGQTASGAIVTRRFSAPGIHTVTLTVTDPATVSATTARAVSVTDINPPTVSAPTVTPSTPVVDQPAVFNTTSTADADGHRIVRYDWAFGDGSEATTTAPQVTKIYTAPGTFIVRVTVTDDVGRTASAVSSISVSVGTTNAPIARFTVSPEVPVAGQSATFDASSSTAGPRAVIVSYTWNFGDGSPTSTSTQPTIGKTFAASGTYAVQLTVIDNNGQANTVGRQVVVTAP